MFFSEKIFLRFNKMPKSKPIPVRLDETDKLYVKHLHNQKGVSESDVLRRAVRLLGQEVIKRGRTWDWIAETAQPLPPIKASSSSDGVQDVLDAEDSRRSRARRNRKSS